jgi:long-chain acyl-CoA synthetase
MAVLMLEWNLAANWAGIVIVPLYTRWSIQESADALSDCGATVLVVDSAL